MHFKQCNSILFIFILSLDHVLTSLFVAGTNIPKMNTPSMGPLTTPMTVKDP